MKRLKNADLSLSLSLSRSFSHLIFLSQQSLMYIILLYISFAPDRSQRGIRGKKTLSSMAGSIRVGEFFKKSKRIAHLEKIASENIAMERRRSSRRP